MEIAVTAKEKKNLDEWLSMMGDPRLTISQRRVARIRYDHLYNEVVTRAKKYNEIKERELQHSQS